MFRRYALPCIVVVIGAMAVALAVYAATPVTYQSSCVFRVGRPLFSFTTSDPMLTAQRISLTEVAHSAQGPVYAVAAKSLGGGVSRGAIQRDTTLIPPAGEQTDYVVQVQDSSAATARRYANAVCSAFVADVSQRRQADVKSYATSLSAQIADLRQQIQTLQSKPKDQLTQLDQVAVLADTTAAKSLEAQLSQTLAQPPELTDVVTTASAPAKTDSRNLGRDLLIGLVAGVLAAFVIILVGEMIVDRQRDLQLRGIAGPGGTPAGAEQRRTLAEK